MVIVYTANKDTSGYWKRFSRYEIRDGFIRPARGAEGEYYDVWEEYENTLKATGIDGGRQPPYQRLFQALRPVLEEHGDFGPLPPKTEAALLDWCAEYGLLGVLLSRVQVVHSAAIWDRDDNEGKVYASQRTYVRHGGRWNWYGTSTDASVDDFLPDEAINGSLVSEEGYRERFQPPGVLIHDLYGGRWKWESLDETWADFFPNARKNDPLIYNYGPPTSERFWTTYAEPLPVFLEAARSLYRSVLGEPTKTHLLRLASSLTPSLRFSGKRYDRERYDLYWAGPSLLASLGYMALLDFTKEKHLRHCQNERCGAVLVARSPHRKFCRPQCRMAVEKRMQRKKLQEKLREEGNLKPTKKRNQ